MIRAITFTVVLTLVLSSMSCATSSAVGVEGGPGTGSRTSPSRNDQSEQTTTNQEAVQEALPPEPAISSPAPPAEKLPTPDLPGPNPFRFDARKKERLASNKTGAAIRRGPSAAVLSALEARKSLDRPEPLSLDAPTPPPRAPRIVPLLPSPPPREEEPATVDGTIEVGRAGAAADRIAPAAAPESVTAAGAAPLQRGPARRRTPGSTSADGSPSADRRRRASATESRPERAGRARAPDGVGEIPPAPESATAGNATDRIAPPAADPAAAGPESATAGNAAPEPPSTGESAAAASAAPPSSPYELTESEAKRSVSAGALVEIELPGDGWLYLGESSGEEATRFVGERQEAGETIFTLRFSRAGSYEVRFQRQDLFEGRVEEHLVRVEAEAPRTVGGEAGVADAEAAGAAEPERTGPTVEAPGIDNEYGNDAVRRWPEDATLEELLAEPRSTIERLEGTEGYTVVSLSRRLVRNGAAQGALVLLEEYERYGRGEIPLDEIWFEMAALLEGEESSRDLRRAHALYERIVDEYPLSPYYERARQRAEHIQRHYFLVR